MCQDCQAGVRHREEVIGTLDHDEEGLGSELSRLNLKLRVPGHTTSVPAPVSHLSKSDPMSFKRIITSNSWLNTRSCQSCPYFELVMMESSNKLQLGPQLASHCLPTISLAFYCLTASCIIRRKITITFGVGVD